MSLIKIKGIFRRNSGLKNSHILQKNQGEPKLFQICVNWNNRQKTVFKSNSVQRIVSLCRNCKETTSKSEKGLVISVIDLVFSKRKKSFQEKARSKEFPYSSERSRTSISKPNYVKRIPLLSRNMKLNNQGNKLIPYKCPIVEDPKKNYFKFGKILPRDKKPFLSQITSREQFLFAETATKLLLKASNAERFVSL